MTLKNILLLAGLGLIGSQSFGQTNKNAISKDSSIIVSWANGISLQRGWVNIADTSVKYSGTNKASYGYPSVALGKAGSTSKDVVSLGDGGIATLTFDRPIKNGVGVDFAVFENAMKIGTDSVYAELAFVEVSSDGSRFVRFPAVSKTQTAKQVGSFAPIFPSNVTNMAGNELQGFGTPFNLDDIKDSTNIDLQNIRFVRIIDAVGDIDPKFASRDSKGTIVNDPFPTPYWSSGFDLDAVGIINAGNPYSVATFDDLHLPADAYFTPQTGDTAFVDGNALFSTEKTAYGINAFNYSNQRNDSTAGYTNSFSAITAGGIAAPDSGGTNYAVAYVTSFGRASTISFNDTLSHFVNGFYVTNATYAYLSMRDGDAYAKKFGGTTSNDADWFKLQIWGVKADGSKTDTIDFYLADFRFADNTKDYIVNDWRWVDLSSLDSVKSIHFALASSDNGQWGMNTPSYFCLDNFTSSSLKNSTSNNIAINKNEVKVYPNPSSSSINVDCTEGSAISIHDVMGRVMYSTKAENSSVKIDLENISAGYYVVKIANELAIKTIKIVIQ